ncbi:MAG TPA: VWA domain-containing protein [Pyrinomonadaceae bacterium]|nr:VWA domain-containing protein [Pyrinomonadaceae bacterium]
MKKLFAPLLPVFLFSLTSLLAQTPTPKPAATPDDDDVVKISTTLIQLDVTVTDKSGKVVTDLKPEDFEIYENGELQEITNFSFISSILQNRTGATPIAAPGVKNAPPVPANVLKPEKVRRTIALVVDDLTLSFQSTAFVRTALKKFVDEQMQEGDLVAIIRTGAGAGALQQFTSDKRQLYAAIERVRWNATGRGNVGAFAPIQSKPGELPDGDLQSDDQQTTTNNPETEYNNFRESVFARGTLGALNYIVRGMQELPGRKSVMLFSDGFKLSVRGSDGFVESSTILAALRHLTDLANRASVVIYTLDARGLQSLGLTAEDNTSAFETYEDFEEALANRRNEFIDTQEGLTYLARQTGGFPLINNNDLSRGVQKVLDDQSYYLVGYQPDTDTFDPKTRRYNKLVVKVRRPGLSVRYRSGFFGITNETAAAAITAKQTPAVQMSNALLSPFAAGGISLRLNALFGNEAKTGAFVRSFLHIDAKDLKFVEQADGTRAATFDVLAVSFGDNGVPVDQIGRTYTMKTKGESYERIQRDGFVYSFVFPIKNPGAYQMRVALRDQNTEKVGSANQFIEVPNLKKERLTLSGIILENLTLAQWEKFSQDAETKPNQSVEPILTNPQSDTSLRRFKRGTVLRYGYEIYNARLDAAQKPQAVTQMKIFRDGKLILEGRQNALNITGQNNMQKFAAGGAINLGKTLLPGDYVLQIIVTDNLAKGKYRTTTQFVQFEIVE